MKGEPLSSVLEPAVETPMVGKSIITLDDLSIRQIQELLHKAQYIDSHRKEVAHTCDGRVLATLFYEPSTRTRLSFETAMLRLGGKVIGFAGAQLASVTKGETISDTLKTVSNYVGRGGDPPPEGRRRARGVPCSLRAGHQRRRWWTYAPHADSGPTLRRCSRASVA